MENYVIYSDLVFCQHNITCRKANLSKAILEFATHYGINKTNVKFKPA